MHFYKPSADFVTSTLNGAISSSATSMTIGTGLNIPATNGILQLDYDSTAALGVDTGPETITYTAYNSSTGALTGVSRGQGNTTGVAHNNGASVQLAFSALYLASNVNYYSNELSVDAAISSNNTYTDGPTVTVAASGRPFLVGCTLHITNGVAAAALVSARINADGTGIPATSIETALSNASFLDHAVVNFSSIYTPSGTGNKIIKAQGRGRNGSSNFTGTIVSGSTIWAVEL